MMRDSRFGCLYSASHETNKPGEISLYRARIKKLIGLFLLLDGFQRGGTQPAFARLGRHGKFVRGAVEHLAVLVAVRVNERAAFFLSEDEFPGRAIEINLHEVAGRHLLCRHKVRDRVNQKTLD